jgi:hypothetical protein
MLRAQCTRDSSMWRQQTRSRRRAFTTGKTKDIMERIKVNAPCEFGNEVRVVFEEQLDRSMRVLCQSWAVSIHQKVEKIYLTLCLPSSSMGAACSERNRVRILFCSTCASLRTKLHCSPYTRETPYLIVHVSDCTKVFERVNRCLQ